MASICWCCSRCGFRTNAARPPERCPGCGQSRLYFILPERPAEEPVLPPSRWRRLEID
ncbi:MAG TPA: hypothetical protein VII38_02905 [Polyangia bacterium]|jgi:hypothetical protein